MLLPQIVLDLCSISIFIFIFSHQQHSGSNYVLGAPTVYTHTQAHPTTFTSTNSFRSLNRPGFNKSKEPTTMSRSADCVTVNVTVSRSSYETNPVGALQERFQSRGITPQYRVVQAEGASHAPTFSFQVILGDLTATGSGSSKKQAKVRGGGYILLYIL